MVGQNIRIKKWVNIDGLSETESERTASYFDLTRAYTSATNKGAGQSFVWKDSGMLELQLPAP